MKYQRSSGVDFGAVDFVKYAESFSIKATHKDGVMHPVEIIESMQKF